MIKIVGLVGKLNSGKGTAASIFEEHGYLSFAMADPLKASLQYIFEELPDAILWGPSEKRTGEVRRMLQELGTDFARKYRPDVWANKLRGRVYGWHFNKTDTLKRYTDHQCREAVGIVVPDVRFPNEADAILELGGILIKILREGSSAHETKEVQNHPSETSVDLINPRDITFTLSNNDTMLSFADELHLRIPRLWIK